MLAYRPAGLCPGPHRTRSPGSTLLLRGSWSSAPSCSCPSARRSTCGRRTSRGTTLTLDPCAADTAATLKHAGISDSMLHALCTAATLKHAASRDSMPPSCTVWLPIVHSEYAADLLLAHEVAQKGFGSHGYASGGAGARRATSSCTCGACSSLTSAKSCAPTGCNSSRYLLYI